MFRLSDKYETIYESILANIASTPKVSHDQSSIFWPMRGHQYDGDLLVIGRDPNGTDVYGNKQEFALMGERKRIIMEVRQFAERNDLCPMYWLTEFRSKKSASDPEYYNWKESAFFRVMSKLSLQTAPKRGDEWASWLCYSNLLKVGEPTSLMKKLSCQMASGFFNKK